MTSERSLAEETLAERLSTRACLHPGDKMFFYNMEPHFFWTFPEPETVEALIRFAAQRGLGEEEVLKNLVTIRAEIPRTMIVKWDKPVGNVDQDNRYVALRNWLAEQNNKKD